MIAMAADVQKIESTMEELEKLEAMERSMSKEGISGRTIEIRGLIKKLMTNPEVVQCLKRLEVKVCMHLVSFILFTISGYLPYLTFMHFQLLNKKRESLFGDYQAPNVI